MTLIFTLAPFLEGLLVLYSVDAFTACCITLHILMSILCPRDFRSHIPSSITLLLYEKCLHFTGICVGIKLKLTNNSHTKCCALSLVHCFSKIELFLIIKNMEISHEKWRSHNHTKQQWPKARAAALLEKHMLCCSLLLHLVLSLIYATSWWGQAFEFMIIDVDNLVNSV